MNHVNSGEAPVRATIVQSPNVCYGRMVLSWCLSLVRCVRLILRCVPKSATESRPGVDSTSGSGWCQCWRGNQKCSGLSASRRTRRGLGLLPQFRQEVVQGAFPRLSRWKAGSQRDLSQVRVVNANQFVADNCHGLGPFQGLPALPRRLHAAASLRGGRHLSQSRCSLGSPSSAACGNGLLPSVAANLQGAAQPCKAALGTFEAGGRPLSYLPRRSRHASGAIRMPQTILRNSRWISSPRCTSSLIR